MKYFQYKCVASTILVISMVLQLRLEYGEFSQKEPSETEAIEAKIAEFERFY